MKRDLNGEFMLLLMAEEDLPPFWREIVLFPKQRRFRYDFVFYDAKVTVEVQGGTWVKSGHTTGKGIRRDCEKSNLAQVNGWILLSFTAGMIDDGTAIETLRQALAK